MAHKCFSIPRKPTNEYAILKRIQKGKTTSFAAQRQIDVLILLDKKIESIAGIAEILEVSSKTITKWRRSYEKEGLESLIFYEEKRSKKKSIGVGTITLINADQANKEELKEKDKKELVKEEEKDEVGNKEELLVNSNNRHQNFLVPPHFQDPNLILPPI